MPCIIARLSVKLDEAQKDNLQQKLADTVSSAFNKPKSYIMADIEDGKALYMNEKKLDKGAYITVRLLGNVSKTACQTATADICALLKEQCGIDGAHVYVTYHPVELWGWNGSMF